MPSPLPSQNSHPQLKAAIHPGPLEEAVLNRDLDTIVHQLRRGASPNHRSKFFGDLVALAVAMSQPEALRALLAAGARPDATSFQGLLALSSAARLGRLDMTQILVDYGASFEIEACDASFFPAFEAARYGQADALRMLFERGARVDIDNHNGRTPLMVAVQESHADCVRVCLAFGADIDAQDAINGHTPAMLALSSSADTMLALCEHGFDLSVQGQNGDTVEDRVLRTGSHSRVAFPAIQLFLAWRLAATETEALAGPALPLSVSSSQAGLRL